MPVILVTHNGKPRTQGGLGVGYAYAGTIGGRTIFLPDANVAAWMQRLAVLKAQQQRLQAEQRRAEEQQARDAEHQAWKEYTSLPMARSYSNYCAACNSDYVRRESMKIGPGDVRPIIFCMDCGAKTRPRI